MSEQITCNPKKLQDIVTNLQNAAKVYGRGKDEFLAAPSLDCGFLLQAIESDYDAVKSNFQQYLTSIAEMMSGMANGTQHAKEVFEETEDEVEDRIKDLHIEMLSSLAMPSAFGGMI